MRPHIFNLIVGVIGILCTILILLALCVKCTYQRKMVKPSLHNVASNPSDSPIYHWRIALDILTNLCIFSCFIHALSVSLIRFNLFPQSHLACCWITRGNIVIYHTMRCSLYGILVLRVNIAFNDSVYGYSRKYIIFPLFIIIFIAFVTAILSDTMLGAVDGEYNTKYEHCSPIFKSYAVLISGTFDIIFCSILLTLFVTPIIKLNRGMKKEQQIEAISSRQLTIDISRKMHQKHNTTYTKTVSETFSTNTEKTNNNMEFCVGINNININIAPLSMNTTASSSFGDTPVSVASNISTDADNEIINNNNISEIDEQKEVDAANGFPDLQCIDENEAKKRREGFIKSKYKKCTMSQHQLKLNEVYEELLSRYALLVILCIGSSFLLYFGIFIYGHWIADLSPIDDAINVWCIILISKKTNKIYHSLCRPCNQLMRICCVLRLNYGLQRMNDDDL